MLVWASVWAQEPYTIDGDGYTLDLHSRTGKTVRPGEFCAYSISASELTTETLLKHVS